MPRAANERAAFPTYDMGEPLIDLTKALALAGQLEDSGVRCELPA